jgi:RNA polymerase sigma-70 factor (ECF subfamily)
MNNKSDEFSKLYDQYVKKIYNFIYYKTYHRETAEDLTSDTFMKALKNFDSFDTNKGSFSSWIYKIARNTVIDFYRTKKNNINIEDVWDLSEEEDLDSDFDAKERVKKVRKYLKKLKSDQREIIILRVWEGMSYKEISEIMNKTETSCRVSFSRTIKQLRKDMPLAIFLLLLL